MKMLNRILVRLSIGSALLFGLLNLLLSPTLAQTERMRIAFVGLDHDHVWELLRYMAGEPEGNLVAIAESDPELVQKARTKVPNTVRFFSDYAQMLDEAKPEVVFVTTENDRHLAILRECAKRHIHYSTEKPMATNAADARDMEQIAEKAGIKLMVNYWNAWVGSSHDLFHRVKAGDIGRLEKIIVQYGHQGPREIGVSKQFAEWLYDPRKNGAGALMDFGCYGAEWALWLEGRPSRVYATARKLKTEQHNEVEDDATIVLDYPDATVIVEPSWDWPYTMDRVYAFGTKGSLLATRNELFFRSSAKSPPASLDGERLPLNPLPHANSNPIAYFLDRVRTNQPIEDPLSASVNVGVMEILDAARESLQTGRASPLESSH